MTPGDLVELARCVQMVPVIDDDRVEFGRALILQGYAPARAAAMAENIEDNDGALQMLARHRMRYSHASPSLIASATSLRETGLLADADFNRTINRIQARARLREIME